MTDDIDFKIIFDLTEVMRNYIDFWITSLYRSLTLNQIIILIKIDLSEIKMMHFHQQIKRINLELLKFCYTIV